MQKRKGAQKMRIKDKISQFFFLEEEEMDVSEIPQEARNQQSSKKELPSASRIRNQKSQPIKQQVQTVRQTENKIVPISQRSTQKPKIKIVEPRTYSEVQSIADLVLKNYTVILNFRRIEKEQAKKILDFLMGTVYAIEGDIQRIGEEIFVCAPSNVDLDGTDLESLNSTEYY